MINLNNLKTKIQTLNIKNIKGKVIGLLLILCSVVFLSLIYLGQQKVKNEANNKIQQSKQQQDQLINELLIIKEKTDYEALQQLEQLRNDKQKYQQTIEKLQKVIEFQQSELDKTTTQIEKVKQQIKSKNNLW